MSRDETRAWLGLSLNLAVLPGVGTLLLRRYLPGLVQLALSSGGAAGSIAWLAWFVREWSRVGHFPLDRGPLFPIALAGTIAFVAAWAWSGRTAWREIALTRGR
ncbi:MAG TPA: hypothetical protein VFQ51_19750 [Vicinamibacteria bacterium]|nr:hypothetical protein [Vicinamibacteria bacterium]